jgi:hypothetical protein
VGDFADNVEGAEVSAEIAELQDQVDRAVEKAERYLRRKAQAERNVKRLASDLEKLQDRLDFVLSMDETIQMPTPWKPSTRKGRKRRGVVHSFISDTHWGEVVDPAEIGGMNAYNSEIGERRLRVVGEKVISLADMIAIDYDGACVFLGGDMFSGTIHRELEMTNDTTIEDVLVDWTEKLVAYLLMMAEHFGKVYVAAMVGNHGRHANDKKMPGKRVALSNADWMLYRNIHMVLKGDSRFTWNLARGHDTTVTVYDTTYLLHHGYSFRGGSGIAGSLSPLMLGQHRATRQQMFAGKSFDWLAVGHFHQHLIGKHLIMNGSLKGYDEHAYKERYEPEHASQAFWITTPENGLSFGNAIFPADPVAEGWGEVTE